MSHSVVLVERPAEGVGLIRINRPEARNALNLEVRRLIAAVNGFALETRATQILFASQDQKEGMAAFIEKRKPRFQGR